jgi:hypothetical protein
MPKDYGMRGEAAMRLIKGGKKGGPPPEEEELGLPPEDAGMPPEEGGAPDLASLLGGGMPGEMPAEEDAMPPGGEMPPEAGMEGAPPEPMDLESALGGVETALEGLAPEAAEEIRTHLNAIREIAATGGGAPPLEEMPPMEGAPPAPDGGASAGAPMMEPQA